ncbi:CP2J2 protein, partial [Sakesphorus luctuosus]|nr:CP2J2 protein [Sakesphorus luctuosus]
QLTKKYGDIVGTTMGSMKVVTVNGMRLFKEVLVNQGENFLERPDIPSELFSKIGPNLGPSAKPMTHGSLQAGEYLSLQGLPPPWQHPCSHLQGFGLQTDRNPFDPQFTLTNAVANVICSLVFGNRFDYHDEDFQKLLKLMYETVMLHGTITAQLYSSFPSIMKFLPGAHQTILKNWELLKSYMKEQINKHKEDWNPSESRDYIDSYLQEIARVQAEIDAVIGQARQPVLEDRNNMPYTNAVIHEVQRKANIIPFNVPRMAVKDTTVDGFFIPKGTILMANITSVMFDENEWETPDTFNPEHFLKDGKFWKRDSFVAFSIGK